MLLTLSQNAKSAELGAITQTASCGFTLPLSAQDLVELHSGIQCRRVATENKDMPKILGE